MGTQLWKARVKTTFKCVQGRKWLFGYMKDIEEDPEGERGRRRRKEQANEIQLFKGKVGKIQREDSEAVVGNVSSEDVDGWNRSLCEMLTSAADEFIPKTQGPEENQEK